MLYRTQVMTNVLPATWQGPSVYTVFIEAENEARAMSLTLRRTSEAWGQRLGDLHLVGRVADELQLLRDSHLVNDMLPSDHVLLELQHDGRDENPRGMFYAHYDSTLFFVGPQWHLRLSQALFCTTAYMFEIALMAAGMRVSPGHKAAVSARWPA